MGDFSRAQVAVTLHQVDGGVPYAFGSAVLGPCALGIVEDLFTLPTHRRRGIGTALIHCAVAHARARGVSTMLIGTHVTEEPKRLYAALGFRPMCLIRHYLRERAG